MREIGEECEVSVFGTCNNDSVVTMSDDCLLGSRILVPGSHELRQWRFPNLGVHRERDLDRFGASELRALADELVEFVLDREAGGEIRDPVVGANLLRRRARC